MIVKKKGKTLNRMVGGSERVPKKTGVRKVFHSIASPFKKVGYSIGQGAKAIRHANYKKLGKSATTGLGKGIATGLIGTLRAAPKVVTGAMKVTGLAVNALRASHKVSQTQKAFNVIEHGKTGFFSRKTAKGYANAAIAKSAKKEAAIKKIEEQMAKVGSNAGTDDKKIKAADAQYKKLLNEKNKKEKNKAEYEKKKLEKISKRNSITVSSDATSTDNTSKTFAQSLDALKNSRKAAHKATVQKSKVDTANKMASFNKVIAARPTQKAINNATKALAQAQQNYFTESNATQKNAKFDIVKNEAAKKAEINKAISDANTAEKDKQKLQLSSNTGPKSYDELKAKLSARTEKSKVAMNALSKSTVASEVGRAYSKTWDTLGSDNKMSIIGDTAKSIGSPLSTVVRAASRGVDAVASKIFSPSTAKLAATGLPTVNTPANRKQVYELEAALKAKTSNERIIQIKQGLPNNLDVSNENIGKTLTDLDALLKTANPYEAPKFEKQIANLEKLQNIYNAKGKLKTIQEQIDKFKEADAALIEAAATPTLVLADAAAASAAANSAAANSDAAAGGGSRLKSSSHKSPHSANKKHFKRSKHRHSRSARKHHRSKKNL